MFAQTFGDESNERGREIERGRKKRRKRERWRENEGEGGETKMKK